MQEVIDGVWQLSGFPKYLVNCYLVGHVLIDTGTKFAKRPLRKLFESRPLRLVALTHVHPDHQGAAHALCGRLGVPLACHEGDVAAMEGRAPMTPRHWLITFGEVLWKGPPHPVDRALRDGDEVGDLRVVHAPGHTPGHVIYFRERDRLALAGDLLMNVHPLTGKPGLRETPRGVSVDPAENRRSLLKLLDLKPSVVCFGHGPPLRDLGQLERFIDRLAEKAAV